MDKVKGIYKITSPSGKVYIGQSTNIKKRISYYRKHGCNRQPKLFASLEKHGFLNHRFELIHELPIDIEKDIINEYERLYIDLYKTAGVEMLNLTDGGEGQLNPSESTRQKLKLIRKGMKHTPEALLKMSEASKCRKHTDEHKKWMSEKFKGRTSPMKGRKHTPESIEKMSQSGKGRKQSPVHIENRAKAWIGRAHSDESKLKMSKLRKGISIKNDAKKKISEAMKGRKFSKESIIKRVKSRKDNKNNKLGILQLF